MRALGPALFALLFGACGDDGGPSNPTGVTTEHCTYEPVPPTARAGGWSKPAR